jgi:hypothetical protein
MENGSPVKEEGSVGAKSSVVKFATDVDPMQTPKNSTTSEHLYYSPGTPGMMTRQSTGTLSAGEKRQSFSLLKVRDATCSAHTRHPPWQSGRRTAAPTVGR